MAQIKKKEKLKQYQTLEDVEQLEFSHVAFGNTSTFENSLAVSGKVKRIHPCDLTVPFSDINPTELNIYGHKNLYMSVMATSLTIVPKLINQGVNSVDEWMNWCISVMECHPSIKRNE